jgi:hypothetical protein
MTTAHAFNEMYTQFLRELNETFPEEQKVKKNLTRPMDAKTCRKFVNRVAPYAEKLMTKDESFFCSENALCESLNLHEIWKRQDCSDTTKNAIWQYIQSLYSIGAMLSMFPPGTLSAIESAAESCVKNMQESGTGLNEQSLMTGMTSMLNQLMSQGHLPGKK